MPALLMAALFVTFPAENQKLPATERTYVIGAAEKGKTARLYLNGVEVPVYRTGSFIAMVKTKAGENRLQVEQGDKTLTRKFFVEQAVAQVPRKEAETQKASATAKPTAGNKLETDHNPYADLGIPEGMTARKLAPGAKAEDVHVMVDAGHGGKDSGAITPRGLKEKDFNLALAKEIAAELRKAGFRVTLTREDDSFPALYDRPKAAIREMADLFISVHHNATAAWSDPREIRHTVTYASNEAGLKAAAAIQNRIARVKKPVKSIGAQMKSLAVCRNPIVPSCLIEVDFINLPEGEESAENAAMRKKVAAAVTEGVKDWMEAQ